MKKKSLKGMAITLNAQSISTIIEKPYIRKFDVRLLKLFDIKTSELITPDKEVSNLISTVQKSYQTPEELCFILDTSMEQNINKSITSSIFTNKMWRHLW